MTQQPAEDSDKVTTASVKWWPWADLSVTVETVLAPPTNRWPDWHVRVHNVRSEAERATKTLRTVEGGFALFGRKTADGRDLPTLDTLPDDAEVGVTEGIIQTDDSVLGRDPKPGSTAVIHHGLLGSFFMDFDGRAGFRAARRS